MSHKGTFSFSFSFWFIHTMSRFDLLRRFRWSLCSTGPSSTSSSGITTAPLKGTTPPRFYIWQHFNVTLIRFLDATSLSIVYVQFYDLYMEHC